MIPLCLHSLHTIFHLYLHLLDQVAHMQNSFNSCQVDTEILHQVTNLYDALNVTVRV